MDIFDEKEKYFPMLAGVSQEDFFSEKNIHLWKVFRTFPQRIQEILKSREITKYIFTIEQKYHLNDAQTEEFSRSVRRYFFREVSEDAFVQHIAQVCGIPPQEGLRMLREMVNITPAPQRDEEEGDEPQQPQRHLVSLPLEQALRQYPAIKDQVVTSVQIVMRSLPQPLKPSVKNWIMVYEKVLGASKHTALERGNFVFRAEPTRGLSQDDRRKLALLLKSRDEDMPLTIDRDQRSLVFDVQPQDDVDNERDADRASTVSFAEESINGTTPRTVQDREGMVRRNTAFPHDVTQYTIRNAVQSVRSSGGFVPQRRDMNGRGLQKPAEDRPQWGQTPVTHTTTEKEVSNSVITSQSAPRKKASSQTQQVSQKISRGMTPPQSRTQQPSRLPAAPQKGLEAPRAMALQSGYGAMVPTTVHAPDRLPVVQEDAVVQGVISFSSNHNLPIERKKKHTLQSTKKYLAPNSERG